MNYLNVLPNYSCLSTIQNPSPVSLTSQKQIKPIPNVLLLHTLSQALTLSLRNYEQQIAKMPQPIQKGQPKLVLGKEKPKNAQKVIEIIISDDEGVENQEVKITDQEIKAMLQAPGLAEKTNNIALQALTDDQNILQSRETSNSKPKHPKQSYHKIRSHNKPSSFQVIIPEVDLIDTAYLPDLGIARQSLANKRQQLMNRKVGDWKDFVKCKKQRREIRMLGN